MLLLRAVRRFKRQAHRFLSLGHRPMHAKHPCLGPKLQFFMSKFLRRLRKQCVCITMKGLLLLGEKHP